MGVKTGLPLILAAALLVGCGSSTPAAKSPSASDVARAEARAVVETAESVWLFEADICANLPDSPAKDTCEKVLIPIRDVLIEAGAAVDTWTDADQGNLPCMFADVKNALVGVKDVLGANAPTKQIYNDLMTLLKAVNTTCVAPDGGEGGAKQSQVL